VPSELDLRQKQKIRRRRFGVQLIAPPTDQAHLIWAFDPDQTGAAQYQAGPSGTVTTPVRTGGAPSLYTFGASDFIDFGDSLDSAWASATSGFTIYTCVNPSSADLLRANSPIVSKNGAAPVYEFQLLLNANTLDFYTLYGGGATNYTAYHSATSLLTTGTRAVLAVTYDPTVVARTARAVLYKNGSVTTGAAPAQIGTDGSISDTAGLLRLGKTADAATAPVSVLSYTYAYNTAHSAGTVASVTSWLQTTKGWT